MSEYQRWEDRFAAPEYIFGTEPNVFLAAQKELLPTRGRALAVADARSSPLSLTTYFFTEISFAAMIASLASRWGRKRITKSFQIG